MFERIVRVMHRWISLPVALFMAAIAITGIILHLQLIEHPPGQQEGVPPPMPVGAEAALPAALAPLEKADAEALLAAAYAHGNTVSALSLRNSDGAPAVTVTLIDGTEIRLARDGSAVPERPAMEGPARPGPGEGSPGGGDDTSLKAHKFIMALHTGDILGPWGKYVAILCGVALVILSLSGLWMYVQMFLRRFRGGRRGLFWS